MKPQSHIFKIIFNVFSYARLHIGLFCLIIFALILTASSVITLGITIRYFIDQTLIGHNHLNNTIIYFIFFACLLGIASFLRIFSVNYFAENFCASMREFIYKKVLNFPMRQYDESGNSQWISFLSTEIDLALTAIISNFATIARNIILFIGAITLLIFNNWRLSALITVIIPIILLIISLSGYKLRLKIAEMKIIREKLFLHFSEAIAFIKIVKIFNQENYELKKLQQIDQKIIDNARSLYIFRGFFFAIMMLLMLLAIAAVLYYGAKLVGVGQMTTGQLSSFIFHSIIAATSIGGIIESFASITRHRPILEKISNLINVPEKLEHENKQIDNIQSFQDLKFTNISFSYPNNPQEIILHDLNFEIKHGEKIAIIGASGSGKSSIINLILHFYNEYNGHILLNNTDIKAINVPIYRNLFSVVQQDISIFSDSIYNNLTYGVTNPNPILIDKILQKLNIKDFIDSLPEGINTMIGNQAIQISGGQKQRIAIARALLKKPQILILDEATAALDNANEQEIYNLLLAEENKDLTVIIVTHRLFNIQKMDKIILINEGRIDAIGNHEELMMESQLYRRGIEGFYN